MDEYESRAAKSYWSRDDFVLSYEGWPVCADSSMMEVCVVVGNVSQHRADSVAVLDLYLD